MGFGSVNLRLPREDETITTGNRYRLTGEGIMWPYEKWSYSAPTIVTWSSKCKVKR